MSVDTSCEEHVVERWLEERSYSAARFSLSELTEAKGSLSVSAILPARDVGSTIGPIVETLVSLRSGGLIDEIAVIDAGSADGTATIAAEQGAEVHQRDELLTAHGPSLGKGDALWRGLSATSGDVVLFLDTDTRNFDASFVVGLLGPLLRNDAIHLVKGAFERPLTLRGFDAEGEGGRVTELVARPLLNLFFRELAGFRQPLAGEIAARRSLLESLSFPVGYGVEIALLIDSWRAVGLDGLAQVDLGRREDRSKPLRELVPMASSVLTTALRRAGVAPDDPGPLLLAGSTVQVPAAERPPLKGLTF